ncbi:VOC family protein [bacterium]|nr:MAG: VOC family protein [bacterium]
MAKFAWHDLTVPDADRVKDFYQAVVGWSPTPLDMGGYDDYVMNDGEEPVSGVCHARGQNASLPPVWLVYIEVEDVDVAVTACKANGGEKISQIFSSGESRYCVLKDPAGAVFAVSGK